MAEHSAIEWTDATWNVVTGCTRVSPGCANCYIERTPPFRMQGRTFARVGNAETTGVTLHPERLEWRKVPRGPRVFVCSLADLFHEEVPDEFIAQVFETMRWHTSRTFQILTKRPERARDWFAWYEQRYAWATQLDRRRYSENIRELDGGFYEERPEALARHVEERYPGTWPLPNVWLGVSIENARYTWRADVLRDIPAAVRFISAEPLLGSLVVYDRRNDASRDREDADASRQGGREREGSRDRLAAARAPLDLTGIDWVIVGGESGPRARPMHPDWAREIRDACRAADGLQPCELCGFPMRGGTLCGDCRVYGSPAKKYDFEEQVARHRIRRRPAFFFKQWGEWAPYYWRPGDNSGRLNLRALPDADAAEHNGKSTYVIRVGKKRAGRELDGRTWDEFPASAAVPA